MRSLYPALQPFNVEMLEVDGGHKIYVEQCGNPQGIPVAFLHGGPGSSCKPDHRQFFDPSVYHIILHDQRGSGRSLPLGAVENNSTALLIDDLEFIRQRFAVPRWALFGGSWGATLALAYAQAHPSAVSAIILRGSFLARRADVDWFFGQGADKLLPREWKQFTDALGIDSTADLTRQLYAGVFSQDQTLVQRIAAAWEAWSGAVVMFSIDKSANSSPSAASATASESAIAKARIEMHYAFHEYFIAENALLDNIHKLPRVPTTIVHGARDITCPAEAAWLLHQAIPGSRLEILHNAGHLSSETAMVDALVRATDEMAQLLT